MLYKPFDRRLANPKNNIGCAIIFLIVAVLYVAAPRPIASSSVTASDACTIAQELVAESLKAPSTATFAPCDKATIGGAATDWRVQSYVDAENSFGAMLRTHYDISMRYDPSTETWTQIALTTD